MNSFTAVSEVNQEGPRILARFGRADRDRAFRAAVRHSKHVRIWRTAAPLPSCALSLWGGAFTFRGKPLRALPGMPVDVGSLFFPATKIKMNQPRLAGVTRDNRRYDMIAQAAAQDVT